MTTKIVTLTNALDNLVRFVLLPGQRFDTVAFRRSSTGRPSMRRSLTNRSTATPSSPSSTHAAPTSSSPSIRAARNLSPSTSPPAPA
ncbi:hypothetical protein JJC00_08450 [Bradyrhizobium diazoefficiens]|uniref:hypothetical protein n=1 Tax=Bradyrhizobium diazoefficiens TaxID=1355477 RepID=UPI00190ADEB1|nr:hypothetical protein [Bradyrhizobium diazoefficiens]QQO35605.1 hypothetical protein JJC00_08450 [Bradyrhizobium diazoefficiens]